MHQDLWHKNIEKRAYFITFIKSLFVAGDKYTQEVKIIYA